MGPWAVDLVIFSLDSSTFGVIGLPIYLFLINDLLYDNFVEMVIIILPYIFHKAAAFCVCTYPKD